MRPTDWTVLELVLLGLDEEDFNKANYILSATDLKNAVLETMLLW